jgi:hypothetical protein
MRLVLAAIVGWRIGLFFVRPPAWFVRVGDRVFKEPGR